MPTPAEFLKTLGASLARFDRPRVAKIGCFASLAVIAAAIVAIAAGIWELQPFFPRAFRWLVLLALGTTIVIFVFFAALETTAEKRASAEIRRFVSGGGADLPTLLEMARLRRGSFPGSDRVIALLERLSSPAP